MSKSLEEKVEEMSKTIEWLVSKEKEMEDSYQSCFKKILKVEQFSMPAYIADDLRGIKEDIKGFRVKVKTNDNYMIMLKDQLNHRDYMRKVEDEELLYWYRLCGLNQTDLAGILNITQGSVSALINGKVQDAEDRWNVLVIMRDATMARTAKMEAAINDKTK